jgi:DNA-binding MarR family transcriptional regulator
MSARVPHPARAARDPRASYADADADALDRMIGLLEAFRVLDPDMPIQYALSLLTIARHEGLSMRELSERLGIAQSSASRNVAALSEWRSFRQPGHGLVRAEEDPRERRRKIVTLTPDGRALIAELEAILAGRATAPTAGRSAAAPAARSAETASGPAPSAGSGSARNRGGRTAGAPARPRRA